MSEQQDWVRQHLAELPAVQMPDEVRSRMAEAIREEAAQPRQPAAVAAAATAAGAGAPASAVADGNGAAASSAGQAPGRWLLGLAGAAAVLVALALVNPMGLTGGGSDGGVVAERAAEPEADAEGERPSRLQIQQASLASPMSYSEASIGERLRGLLTGSGGTDDSAETAGPVSEPTPGSAPAGELPSSWREAGQVPAATMQGLVDCVWALPWDGELLLVVERAAYNTDPAIIVVRQEGSRWEILVQGSSCSASDPYLLHRATVER